MSWRDRELNSLFTWREGAPPRSNISDTRKSVSSDIQTLGSGLKKQGAAEFFLTNFEVFGYLETFFRVFDMVSQSINDS